jgi:hypothetical protein
MAADPSEDRPKNREVENEEMRPEEDASTGGPPRPASEPAGSKASQQSSKTATDPGTGLAKPAR